MEQSAVCVWDGCTNNTIPCRCTEDCSVDKPCDKTHHPLFNGTVKDVVFGIACPPSMQAALQHALLQILPKTKIVTIIVNTTLYPHDLVGELRTMKEIDGVDPGGVFTAKLIYTESLEPSRRSFRGKYCNDAIDVVLHKLEKDDNSTAMKVQMAPSVCSCGSGALQSNCCNPQAEQCTSERNKYEELRKRMQVWSETPVSLQYIFMEFSGNPLAKLQPGVLSQNTKAIGFQHMLTNYLTLYEHGICHLDLHDSNLTWSLEHQHIPKGRDVASCSATRGDDKTDPILHIKFIDFGFHRQFDPDVPAVYKRADRFGAIDATKMFTYCCRVTQDVRWWHPIEYPMFHMIASLLLAPFLNPRNTWRTEDHQSKVRQLTALTLHNVREDNLNDYGDKSGEVVGFHRKCLQKRQDLRHVNCKRSKFFTQIYSVMQAMRHWYKEIQPQKQQQVWGRICHIVGSEITRTNFNADGTQHAVQYSENTMCLGGEMFTTQVNFLHLVDVFRTQYYFCDHLDMATVEREFDTWSMAMNILKTSTSADVELRRIVHETLLSSHSFEQNKNKLADSARQLGCIVSDRTPSLDGGKSASALQAIYTASVGTSKSRLSALSAISALSVLSNNLDPFVLSSGGNSDNAEYNDDQP